MSFPLVALGELCEIQIGKTPSRAEPGFWRDGHLPWLSIADMNQGRALRSTKECITSTGAKAANMKLVEPGTLLLSYKLSIGKVGIAEIPLYTNEAIAALSCLRPDVDIAYMYWALRHIDLSQGADRAAMGSTLNKAKLKSIKFPIPDLVEQRRIAAILDKADALRTQRRAAIAKLDELLQSVFIEMFGDPVSNPKAWVQLPIDSVADIGTGSTPSRANKDYYGGHIPWVKTTEIIGEPIVDTEEKLTSEGLRAIRGKLHPKGSVIVAMYGQGQTRGRCGLLMIEASCNQACGVIRPSKRFNSVFLLWQLRLGYERLRELGRGGNQENLNLQLLGGFEVLLPPLWIQERFADVATKIEAQKQTMQRAAEKTEYLFASLQQRAFSGKL